LTAALPFTGERFTPEVRGAIWYEHWHRYCAALGAAAGKRVLDAACGEGYGSGLLAQVAAGVTAVDIDAGAIAHASQRYRDRANLRYLQASCTALPLPSASVDLIVSFETIEHLVEQDAMLDEFRRVLAGDGVLIISSPNKAIYSEQSGQTNHFHVRELSREELSAMLATRFPAQAWYGQRVSSHSLLWADGAGAGSDTDLIALKGARVETLSQPAAPMYFVVACGADGVTLPRLASLSLFDDGEQSLYRDYERALLAEKRLYWDELDARKIAQQRLEQAVAVTNQLGSARQREEALAARIPQLEAELARCGREFTRVEGELVDARRAHRQAADECTHLLGRLRYRESARGWLRWPLARARQWIGGRLA